MDKINIEEVITQIIAWTSTLGAGGTLIALKLASKLSRALFKLLFAILLIGLIMLVALGYTPFYKGIFA